MAERFRVDVIGDEELRSKLQSLTAAVQGQVLAAAVMSGAQVIQNAAKEKAPYRTGTLKRSIHSEIEASDATRATAIIGTDVPYGAQVEFGGTITPKKKKLLHWVDADGQDHFAKSVTQVARPYLRPAFDEKSDDAAVEVGNALRQAIAKVAP
jgi:HK97 gp10 family phage protein